MLDFLREKKRGIMSTLVLAFAAVLIASWGLESRGNYNQKQVAITVDDKEVSYNDYYRQYQQYVAMLRNRLGVNFDAVRTMLNLEQQTVDRIIDNIVLDRFLAENGFGAGTRQVEEKIAVNPFFEGSFSPEKYRMYLRGVGVSEPVLEEMVKREITNDQLLYTFSDLAIPTNKEAERIYAQSEALYRFRSVAFAPKDFIRSVKVEDEKLAAYFEKKKERYQLPKAVRFEFVPIRSSDYESKVEVSEEDLNAAYEANRNLYREPGQYHLRQIVIDKEAPSENPLENMLNVAKEKSQKAIQRLEANEDFEKVARETSDDAESAAKGGDMGWMMLEALDETLQKSVANLSPGERTEPIETSDAFYILRLDEYREGREKPLSEVRAEVEKLVREDLAPEFMAAAADDIYGQWMNADRALSAFAGEQRLTVADSAKLRTADDADDSLAPSAVLSRALELSVGDKQLIDGDKISYLLEVKEVRDARQAELAEVREKVIEDFKAEEARHAAKAAAEEALQKLTSGALKGLEGLGKEVKESSEVKREVANEAYLVSPENKQKAFALTEPGIVPAVLDSGAEYHVAALTEMKPADMGKFAAERQNILTSESKKAGTRIYGRLLSILKRQSEIVVNPDILSKNAM